MFKRIPTIIKREEYGSEEESVTLLNTMFVESITETDEFTEITMTSGDFHHTHMSAKELMEWLFD